MHKASRLIIEYALQNECDTIVIGDIKDIKQNMQGNKRFVTNANTKLSRENRI